MKEVHFCTTSESHGRQIVLPMVVITCAPSSASHRGYSSPLRNDKPVNLAGCAKEASMNASNLLRSSVPSCGSVSDHLPRKRRPAALLVQPTSLPVTSSPLVMRSITPCKARATAVAVGVAVAVGAAVAVAVAVAVGVGVNVAVAVAVAVAVGVNVAVGVGVNVAVAVTVGVRVGVGVGEGLVVRVAVGDGLGVRVAVGVEVGVGLLRLVGASDAWLELCLPLSVTEKMP